MIVGFFVAVSCVLWRLLHVDWVYVKCHYIFSCCRGTSVDYGGVVQLSVKLHKGKVILAARECALVYGPGFTVKLVC
jgi:hypothetical protein